MTRHLLAFATATLVCLGASGASSRQAPVGAGAEADRLVRAVLESSFASGAFPDIGLLPRWGTIPVVSDVAGLSDAALPQLADWKFKLQSREALVSAATSTRQNIFYASVSGVRIEGATARLWVGVNFVEPSTDTPSVRMCCCGAQLEYRKVGVGWVFSKTLEMICA